MAGTRSDQTSCLGAVRAATGSADFHTQPIVGANQRTAKRIKVPQIKVLLGGGVISWCSEYTRTHTRTSAQASYFLSLVSRPGINARQHVQSDPCCFLQFFSVIHRQSDGHAHTQCVCDNWSAHGISCCPLHKSMVCECACMHVCRITQRGCFWLAYCFLWENSWQLPELTLFCTRGIGACVCVRVCVRARVCVVKAVLDCISIPDSKCESDRCRHSAPDAHSHTVRCKDKGLVMTGPILHHHFAPRRRRPLRARLSRWLGREAVHAERRDSIKQYPKCGKESEGARSQDGVTFRFIFKMEEHNTDMPKGEVKGVIYSILL